MPRGPWTFPQGQSPTSSAGPCDAFSRQEARCRSYCDTLNFFSARSSMSMLRNRAMCSPRGGPPNPITRSLSRLNVRSTRRRCPGCGASPSSRSPAVSRCGSARPEACGSWPPCVQQWPSSIHTMTKTSTVPRQPPPHFQAAAPASSPRNMLFMAIDVYGVQGRIPADPLAGAGCGAVVTLNIARTVS